VARLTAALGVVGDNRPAFLLPAVRSRRPSFTALWKTSHVDEILARAFRLQPLQRVIFPLEAASDSASFPRFRPIQGIVLLLFQPR
jgi:hypothetical protein